jgi:hypothetical protein
MSKEWSPASVIIILYFRFQTNSIGMFFIINIIFWPFLQTLLGFGVYGLCFRLGLTLRFRLGLSRGSLLLLSLLGRDAWNGKWSVGGSICWGLSQSKEITETKRSVTYRS